MFIVPDVVRFSVNQSIGSRNLANVLDYQIEETLGPETREEIIKLHADLIATAWNDTFAVLQSSIVALENVSWVDLSSATGSTGTGGDGATPPWPTNASGTGAIMPNNVAVLMHKNLLGSSRGSRRGRMYIGGIQEGATGVADPSNLGGSDAAAFSTAGTNFLEQTSGALAGYDAALAVVHILTRDGNGNPLTGSSSAVVSFLVDPTLATQRRRLR